MTKTFTEIALECAIRLRRQKYGDMNTYKQPKKPVEEFYTDGDVLNLAKAIADNIKDEVLKALL